MAWHLDNLHFLHTFEAWPPYDRDGRLCRGLACLGGGPPGWNVNGRKGPDGQAEPTEGFLAAKLTRFRA